MALTVKICGVKSPGIAELAFRTGADWVGVVLSESRRQVAPGALSELLTAFPGRLVAVVKDPPPALWDRLWEQPWAGIQVHGAAPSGWAALARAQGRLSIQAGSTEADRGEAEVLLLDGTTPGSGVPLPWGRMRRPRSPFWLAGGLDPDNVKEAVDILKPQGVDVSSGVERGGEKDPDLVVRFIQEVKSWRAEYA